MDTHTRSFIENHTDPSTKLLASDPVLVKFADGKTSVWEKRSVELLVFKITDTERKINSIISDVLNKNLVLTSSITGVARQIVAIEINPKLKASIQHFINTENEIPYNHQELCTLANKYLDRKFEQQKEIKELEAQLQVLHTHKEIGKLYAQQEAKKSRSHSGSSRYRFDELAESLSPRSAYFIITIVTLFYATILIHSLNSNSEAEL